MLAAGNNPAPVQSNTRIDRERLHNYYLAGLNAAADSIKTVGKEERFNGPLQVFDTFQKTCKIDGQPWNFKISSVQGQRMEATAKKVGLVRESEVKDTVDMEASFNTAIFQTNPHTQVCVHAFVTGYWTFVSQANADFSIMPHTKKIDRAKIITSADACFQKIVAQGVSGGDEELMHKVMHECTRQSTGSN